MDISKLNAGKNPPSDINVVIEVPMNSSPVKYEFDKDSGFVFVDRFLSTAMFYPCNYGFIPHTLSGDGDPVDVLVVADFPVVPGSVIRCRPVGVLKMEDEKGEDEKILAVPHGKLTKTYENIEEYSDLPKALTSQIAHFFERYKDLEEGKFVKVQGWEGKSAAENMIEEGVKRAKNDAAAA
jgi:inorganic pyrophosphatase